MWAVNSNVLRDETKHVATLLYIVSMTLLTVALQTATLPLVHLFLVYKCGKQVKNYFATVRTECDACDTKTNSQVGLFTAKVIIALN